jgi:O-antigen/teichoic acid export membrane protein
VLVSVRQASQGLTLVASESAMEFAATVSFVLAGGGATGAAFGRAAGYAFGVVLGIGLLARLLGRSPIFRTGRSPVARRQFASYAGAMFVLSTATAVYGQLDVLLLGSFLTAGSVGVYSAPLRLIAFMGYPGLAVAQGVSPRLARHPDDPPRVRALVRGLGYVALFQAWLTAVLLAWAGPLVDLLLGAQFAESASVLRALTPAIFLSGIGPLITTSLNYAGEGRRRIPFAIGSVLIAAALYVLLIPKIGVLGAAVGSDIASAFIYGGNLWLARRFIGMPLTPLATSAARALIAAAATAGILALFGTHQLTIVEAMFGIFMGTTAFIAILLALREISLRELRRLVLLPARALGRS